ncbi:MAG: MBOAT family O-acyltransferase [Leptospiraceae bacterium]|nr:MBOAT family O-acyltransferase [Leptospiraceae bacterium]
MLFNSVLFLVFFLLVYSLYHFTSYKFRKPILLISSMIFYSAWEIIGFGSKIPFFLLHFISVILINYLFILYFEKEVNEFKRKLALTIILFLNITNLCFFKYLYFFVEITGLVFGHPEWRPEFEKNFHIILPIAISFYTFQTIAFVVDKFKKEIPEHTTLTDFSIFIFFFPQQLAGPILRARDFLPSLHKEPEMDENKIYDGLIYIGLGLMKKGILADSVAIIVNPVFQSPSDYSWLAISISCILFYFQLWGDFSGYSDMAIGCAKLLGFDLPRNFNAPLAALSFREMWERWHITLSSFLRDYIYIPLGGNKVSNFRASFNSIFTMTLAGLWHGANWNYLIWGLSIGIHLVVERLFLNRFSFWKETNSMLNRIVKLFLLNLTWFYYSTIFRVNSLSDFGVITKKILTLSKGKMIPTNEILTLTLLFGILHHLEYKSNKLEFLKRKPLVYSFAIGLILLFFLGDLSNKQTQFIYFQF